jgi:putative hemolysin
LAIFAETNVKPMGKGEEMTMPPDSASEITPNLINIRKVIASKSERLARMLPGFVYRYLRKILHQDEINAFLYENRYLSPLEFTEATIRFFNLKIVVHGAENIPRTGKVTVVSNHPLGGLDGIAILNALIKVRTDIRTVVNDLMMFLPNVRPLFLPVNKHGRNDEYVTLINQAFAEENMIPLFPAGLCSRKQDGEICDLEWKSTFINQSRRNQRVILPVHFSGRNSNFFYNLARLRKFLKIKPNIEMFFLVNEMFKQHNKEFVITIGKPIPPETFDKSKKPQQWAQWVKDLVYTLGQSQTNASQ